MKKIQTKNFFFGTAKSFSICNVIAIYRIQLRRTVKYKTTETINSKFPKKYTVSFTTLSKLFKGKYFIKIKKKKLKKFLQ